MSNCHPRRQFARGLTLVELSITVAVLGVITIGMFTISGSMLNTYSIISKERYKTAIRSILNQYYREHLPSDTNLKTLVGASVPSVDTINADDLYKYKGLGAGDLNLSVDEAGNKWHYVTCSTGGDVEHSQIENTINASLPNSLLYCDIIAYTTNNNTAIAGATLGNKTIQDWENGVDGTGPLAAVTDFVVVRGKPIVSQAINDAWADIAKTRVAMEAYYLQQYEKNRELGIAVSRFANGPISSPANEEFYDFQSIFSNTQVAGTDIDPTVVFGLGLSDEDVSNLLGDMSFDNSSSDVRHPENATPAKARPPYTARIWYDLCGLPDCTTPNSVIIEGIASSGSP